LKSYNKYRTNKAFEGFGGFKIGGQGMLKNADDFVLLAKD
jgi:hypothetical protein